jgi:hypothetical protein
VELALTPGSTNVLVAGFQTEEAEIALVLNATRNAVVWGSLNAFWDASKVSPTPVLAARHSDAAGLFDLSYRLFSLSVPIAASEQALFVDVVESGGGSYSLPANALFASAQAIVNGA